MLQLGNLDTFFFKNNDQLICELDETFNFGLLLADNCIQTFDFLLKLQSLDLNYSQLLVPPPDILFELNILLF